MESNATLAVASVRTDQSIGEVSADVSGHIKLDCPSARSFGPAAGAGAPGQRCYTCGRFGKSCYRESVCVVVDTSGHIARACPGVGGGFGGGFAGRGGFGGARGGFGGGFGGGGFPPRPRMTANPDGTPVRCQ